ncbi:hypothetical protein [uncultured Algibacter sp.]|uniref:hypothetical protein n=1 Tax=uncultured Algibacter sp. TaxID=298659 RepID=UPI00261D64CB|nr:hypothetical protein [uncultured Algibacter sp.]
METVECKYCLSDIPKKAAKCRYCLEWQDKVRKKNIKDNTKRSVRLVDNLRLKKPFQLILVEKLPLPYYISVFVICITFFAIIQFSWYRLNEDKIYLLSFLAFTIQMIISWSCLIWIYNVINDKLDYFIKVSSLNKRKAEDKFYSYNAKMFNNKRVLVAGFLAGIIASAGDYIVGTPFETQEAKFLFAGFEFLYMLFAGAAIYSMMYFAMFLNQLTTNPKKNLMNIDQKRSIHKIGSIHLKTSVLAIIPFFLGVVAKLIGDWSWELPIVLWYASFAIAIIIYIYWPLLNVHGFMSYDIENQLAIVQNKIRNKLNDIEIDPSSSNFTKLNELRALENSIAGQNTWPFDTKSLSAIFAAIIAPILLMIVDKFWSI